METVLIALVGIALVAAVSAAARAFLGMQSILKASQKPSEGSVTADLPSVEYTELRAEIDTLRQAVAHGIEQRERNDRRIEAVVRRARKELADSGMEHGGLEAEVGDLQLVDAGGSYDQWMPPVPDRLATGEGYDPPSGVPGFTVSQLAEFRARQA